MKRKKLETYLKNKGDNNSPFCVPVKVTKLIGLKRPPFLSPTNLIIFACTQNRLKIKLILYVVVTYKYVSDLCRL